MLITSNKIEESFWSDSETINKQSRYCCNEESGDITADDGTDLRI